jgi:hypothetical protein
MNSKEIELILQARLEASDAEKDALKMGSAIGDAIEKAFDGLGTRLAEKFASEFSTAIKNSGMLTQNAFLGNGPPEGLGFGGTSSGSPERSKSSGGFPSKDEPITSYTNDANTRSFSERIGGTAGGSGFGYTSQRRGFGIATLLSDSFKNIPGAADALEIGREEANTMDRKLRRYEIFKETKKFNPNFTLDQVGLDNKQVRELKTELTGLGTAAATKLADGKLEERIERLTQVLEKNAAGYEKAVNSKDKTPQQELLVKMFEKRTEEKENLIKTENDLKGSINTFGRQVNGIGNHDDLPWYKDQAKLNPVGRGLMAGAVIGDFASNLPYSLARGAAGAADVNNMASRDYMSGNTGGILATELAGGYDAVRGRAKLSAGLDIGVGVAGGLGQMVLGGAFAESGIGAMIGLNGLKQVGSSAKDFVEFEGSVSRKMREDQSLSYSTNQEVLDMYGKSRANSLGAYADARATGSERHSDFLTGVNKDGSPGMYDQSKDSGLSRGEIYQSMKSIASGMGGVYNDYNVLDSKNIKNAIVRGNNLKGQGFNNIQDVSAQMFQGQSNSPWASNQYSDREDAMTSTQDRYLKYREGGLESGAISTLGAMMGQRGSGFDMAGSAGYNADVAAAYASANKLNNVSGITSLMKAQTGITESTNTGQGMLGIAKIQSIKQLEKDLGRGLSKAERYALQMGTAGKDTFRGLLGSGASDTEVNDKFEKYQGSLKSNVIGMYERSLGKDSAENKELASVYAAKELGGATGASEILSTGKFYRTADGKLTKMPDPNTLGAATNVPGKAEQAQDTKREIMELIEGQKLLKTGFDVLATAAEAAAKRLREVSAGGIKTAAERDKEKEAVMQGPSVGGEASMKAFYDKRANKASPAKTSKGGNNE